MAIIKMKRLTVFAHKRDAEGLIKRLMRLRCVEIARSDAEEDDPSLTYGGDGQKCAAIEERIKRIETAISSLSKYSDRKKGLFGSGRISVRLDKFAADGSYGRAMNTLSESEALFSELGELERERIALGSKKEMLSIWQGYDIPFEFAGTDKSEISYITIPASVSAERIEELLCDTEGAAIKVGGDKTVSAYALISYRGSEDEAMRRLGAAGALRAPVESLEGDAKKNLSDIERRIQAIRGRSEQIEKRLRELAASISDIEVLYDVECTNLEAERQRENLLLTECCVKLSGWVPITGEERVRAMLSKLGVAFDISEPSDTDEPPVLLKNNFFASTFEWVLGMYSYPKYGTYDPTFIMSIFYFIIFGLMFADVGYGFILVVACFGALKLLNPRQGMRNFLAMFGYCGISSMIMGVLFGAYFGNLPQAYAQNMMGIADGANMKTAILFDPLQDPMSFLLVSLAIGAVHLIVGMAVQFYILCRKGEWLDAIFDIATWWLAFAGLGLTFLFPWGKYVALAGVISIVLTAGRREKNPIMKLAKGLLGLYGAVNYAADLLSYSRILALGLAASVIAQVVNTMGTMGGPTFVGFIIMAAVFIIGHLLNLVINVLGTFVHTSRLQYIEFFGKFFEDGGKPFRASVPSDKYTTEQ